MISRTMACLSLCSSFLYQRRTRTGPHISGSLLWMSRNSLVHWNVLCGIEPVLQQPCSNTAQVCIHCPSSAVSARIYSPAALPAFPCRDRLRLLATSWRLHTTTARKCSQMSATPLALWEPRGVAQMSTATCQGRWTSSTQHWARPWGAAQVRLQAWRLLVAHSVLRRHLFCACIGTAAFPGW
jgi:hypothetical protein